jgi:hypothetical protein
MKMKCGDMTLNLTQRASLDDINLGSDLIYTNNFIVEFPEELGVRFYDVVSIDFLKDKTCRFTIRNNSTTIPLFSLNKYRHSCSNILKWKRDNISIHYLDRENNLLFTSVLKKIKINDIFEEQLTYKDDKPQTIIFDIKYSKRTIEKSCNNQLEGE